MVMMGLAVLDGAVAALVLQLRDATGSVIDYTVAVALRGEAGS
jgi:hypothetical protein